MITPYQVFLHHLLFYGSKEFTPSEGLQVVTWRTLVDQVQQNVYGDISADLFAYLSYPDEDVQEKALVVLNAVYPEKAVPYILVRLQDESWQFSLCYWIARYGSSTLVVPAIGQLLNHANDPDTQYMAVAALTTIGSAEVVPYLEYAVAELDGVDHDGHSIKDLAAEALLALRDTTPQPSTADAP